MEGSFIVGPSANVGLKKKSRRLDRKSMEQQIFGAHSRRERTGFASSFMSNGATLNS